MQGQARPGLLLLRVNTASRDHLQFPSLAHFGNQLRVPCDGAKFENVKNIQNLSEEANEGLSSVKVQQNGPRKRMKV